MSNPITSIPSSFATAISTEPPPKNGEINLFIFDSILSTT